MERQEEEEEEEQKKKGTEREVQKWATDGND